MTDEVLESINAIKRIGSGEARLLKAGFREFELYGDIADKVWVWTKDLPSPGPDWPPMIHIMIIKRGARRIGVDRFAWFQEVKNQVMGENCEAVEIYPAEDRLRDMAHAYHLWGFADGEFRLPFGMWVRGVKG